MAKQDQNQQTSVVRASHATNRQSLLVLPSALLGSTWPPERVVAGLRLCKRVREDLQLFSSTVLLSRQDRKKVEEESLVKDFCRLSGFRICVRFRFRYPSFGIESQLLLLGQEEKLNETLKHNLTELKRELVTLRRAMQESKAVTELDICSNKEIRSLFSHLGPEIHLVELLRSCNLRSLSLVDVGSFVMDDNVRALSEVLIACPMLSSLHLREISISGESMLHLGEALQGCTALTHLDLRGMRIIQNTLAGLAGLRQYAKLTHLDLSDCFLQYNNAGAQLAQALGGCTALTRLMLNNNFFSRESMGQLAEALLHCQALKHLDLHHNLLSADELERLAGAATAWTCLEHLNLSFTAGGDVGADDSRNLAALLGECTALKGLRLSGNHLDDVAAERVAEGLRECRGLTLLEIAASRIRPAGALALAERVSRTLTTLDLGYNELHLEGVASVVRGLRGCSALTHLDLSGNLIGSNGAGLLAGLLEECTGLVHLALQGNKIRKLGRLAKVLTGCPRLQRLDLQNNWIWKVGGPRELAAVVRACSSLTWLGVSQNQMGSGGLRLLAEGLASNTALSSLSLGASEVGLGKKGARKIGLLFGQCRALRRLRLGLNQLGDEGVQELAAGLAGCARLSHLDLRLNEATADAVGHLAVLSGSTSLEDLDLQGNSIGDDGAGRLAELVESIPSLRRVRVLGSDLQPSASGVQARGSVADSEPPGRARLGAVAGRTLLVSRSSWAFTSWER